jgi:predicted enzyme related to lactoylglutathione lyase
MPFVGYVEFNVPDLEATSQFYGDVFGWEPTPFFEGYLSVQHGDEPGIDIGIQQAEGPATTVATILVPDVEATSARIAEHGGTVVMPKFPVPGVGYAAYFTDPNGMTVGIWEVDTDAA